MRMNIRVEQELKVNSYYKIATFCNDIYISDPYYHSEIAEVSQFIDPPIAETLYLNMCGSQTASRPMLEFHTPSNIKKGWSSMDYQVLMIGESVTYRGENQRLKEIFTQR